MIHVCSLAALPATVEATGARHILTVMANVGQVVRPASVLEANHLRIQMDDINEPAQGFVAPSHDHVEQALTFIRKWDRAAPMVIHCYAGISRFHRERIHGGLRTQSASRRILHCPADPVRIADRVSPTG